MGGEGQGQGVATEIGSGHPSKSAAPAEQTKASNQINWVLKRNPKRREPARLDDAGRAHRGLVVPRFAACDDVGGNFIAAGSEPGAGRFGRALARCTGFSRASRLRFDHVGVAAFGESGGMLRFLFRSIDGFASANGAALLVEMFSLERHVCAVPQCRQRPKGYSLWEFRFG